MAAETAAVRTLGRRVKTHILTRYLSLADRVDEKGIKDLDREEKDQYLKLTDKFAPNCIPKTQEITGDEGRPINIVFDPTFNEATRQTTGDSEESSSIQDNQSGA